MANSLFAMLILLSCYSANAQKNVKLVSPLLFEKGSLIYQPDSFGNRIPDFSFCGFMASESAIPVIPVKVIVPLSKGDATLRIQSAIDYVAGLPLDDHGFRGTVLLQKGTYLVSGQLKISAAGIVLRGSGSDRNGTIILGTGEDRQTLIRVAGVNDKSISVTTPVADAYVPVNATRFSVQDAGSLKAGDIISLRRPATLNWIRALGADHFGGGITALGWKPGERDLFFERKIIAVENNTITIDAPLTVALDSNYGGGFVSKIHWPGRIEIAGIENLQLKSVYDSNNLKDEAHRWMAITMENIKDAWVRQVVFMHFAGSAVNLLETTKQVTVEDCISLEPVSEIGGQRRYTFLTAGQQNLFQRCFAENGYHDFAVGFCAPGPNAFVQCQSVQPFNFSGTIDSWSPGVLFDIVNVDGEALRFGNRGQDAQGAGWTTANSVFWQCSAARIDCYKTPAANNYSFGSWAQFSGDGYWESSNEHIKPRSLFYAQLSARLGDSVMERAQLLPVESEASSSPPVSVAMELTAKSVKPAPLLVDWIKTAAKRNPIITNTTGNKSIDELSIKETTVANPAPAMRIQNGWLVRGNVIVTGARQEVPWWSGSIMPDDLSKAKPHITRFVPGRTGTGLTDDLDAMTDSMKARNQVAIEHNYGLWYDRRRDDHERIRRMDGEVWPPFYELPFKRSGIGKGWDGLSKYDLTRYNPWYWNRLKQFADIADQKSLVLIHQNYFQHNIIEAGAHYVDFPWRPANNINETGFPEPVPFAGDKRIFMADQFYNLGNANRKRIHTAYIRKCLDNFKNNSGVIQLLSAEYTGPLHFAQFWLDVIKAWEKETGKKELIGLSTTKDVQDSILSDKFRSEVVEIIDIRYWHYQEDGKAYEPKGGQNLAPRQHARLLKPKRSSFEQVYRAVGEYKTKYPSKAVMYSADNAVAFAWAVFMAGGSLAAIPAADPDFLADAVNMKPVKNDHPGEYILSDAGKKYIVYTTGNSVKLNVKKPGSYMGQWIDPVAGKIIRSDIITSNNTFLEIDNPLPGPSVLWLSLK